MVKPSQQPRRAELRHAHMSSRYSKTPESLAKALRRVRRNVDIVTVTEVSAPERAAALNEPGWETVHFPGRGRGECAVVFNEAVWRDPVSEVTPLTAETFKTGSGRTRAVVHALTVHLTHVNGVDTALVTVAHLPSGVEGRGGWSSTVPRVRAYVDSVKAWVVDVDRLARLTAPTFVVVSPDWNLNWRGRWVRRWMERQWAPIGLVTVWTRVWLNFRTNRGQGTFLGSDRVIDGPLVKRSAVVSHVHIEHLHPDESDHRVVTTHIWPSMVSAVSNGRVW